MPPTSDWSMSVFWDAGPGAAFSRAGDPAGGWCFLSFEEGRVGPEGGRPSSSFSLLGWQPLPSAGWQPLPCAWQPLPRGWQPLPSAFSLIIDSKVYRFRMETPRLVQPLEILKSPIFTKTPSAVCTVRLLSPQALAISSRDAGNAPLLPAGALDSRSANASSTNATEGPWRTACASARRLSHSQGPSAVRLTCASSAEAWRHPPPRGLAPAPETTASPSARDPVNVG